MTHRDHAEPIASARTRRLEGIREILSLTWTTLQRLAELHNTHRVCHSSLIRDCVFRDPEIPVSENPLDLQTRTACQDDDSRKACKLLRPRIRSPGSDNHKWHRHRKYRSASASPTADACQCAFRERTGSSCMDCSSCGFAVMFIYLAWNENPERRFSSHRMSAVGSGREFD